MRVDGIDNGCLLRGFVNEQVHIVVGEGREQLDGHVTELLGGTTGVMLSHACQWRPVNTRQEKSSRESGSQSSCCKHKKAHHAKSEFIALANLIVSTDHCNVLP